MSAAFAQQMSPSRVNPPMGATAPPDKCEDGTRRVTKQVNVSLAWYSVGEVGPSIVLLT